MLCQVTKQNMINKRYSKLSKTFINLFGRPEKDGFMLVTEIRID